MVGLGRYLTGRKIVSWLRLVHACGRYDSIIFDQNDGKLTGAFVRLTVSRSCNWALGPRFGVARGEVEEGGHFLSGHYQAVSNHRDRIDGSGDGQEPQMAHFQRETNGHSLRQ